MSLFSQVDDKTAASPEMGIFDQLASHELAEFTVVTELKYLIDNKKISDEYVESQFNYLDENENEQSIKVKVKCRGRYRRMKCDFPPLKLKFKKKHLSKEGLNEFNELKLVTHCIAGNVENNDMILRELLAYDLFNILTPYSFRAQLAHVTYVDANDEMEPITGWGILIEDSDELADRMGGEKYFRMGVPVDSFCVKQEMTTAMFNYMIGNTDWSHEMVRNVEMIKMPDEEIYVVPYDFDFAAMVGAPYALPNRDVGQKSLEDRHYMGHKCSKKEMELTIAHFEEKKEAIFEKVKKNDYLMVSSKYEIKRYLKEFYKNLECKTFKEAGAFK